MTNSEINGKPKTYEELRELIRDGFLSVQLSEELDDGTTHLLVLDNRQQYKNEVYELWI